MRQREWSKIREIFEIIRETVRLIKNTRDSLIFCDSWHLFSSLYEMNSLTGVSSFADDTKLYGEQCPQSYNITISDSLADMVDWPHLNYIPTNLKSLRLFT